MVTVIQFFFFNKATPLFSPSWKKFEAYYSIATLCELQCASETKTNREKAGVRNVNFDEKVVKSKLLVLHQID